MKKILTLVIILNSLLFATNTQSDNEAKKRAEEQIKKEMEKEKKYAKEQTFYKTTDYDLKGAEINKDSLSTLPHIEVDELDMDSVYD